MNVTGLGDNALMRKVLFLFISALILALVVPVEASAGGGCGVSNPSVSNSYIKPGQTFYVDFSFVQNDSNINYSDPKIAPEVNFSSSLAFLQQRMTFRGLDSNNWAQYRATFQIPTDFTGNQNLQAVVIYPSCEGLSRTITYGPQITIQSSPSIPTCTIEDLQVADYSVKIGETFKVGFKVFSNIAELKPVIELTDSTGKKVFPTRLAGSSGTDLKIYEASLSYVQAYQFNYGAIARAVVEGSCNSSGQRQVIGINGYITSMAILQPIYPELPCTAQGSSVKTKNNQLIDEELFCNVNPDRGNTLTWMRNNSVQKSETLESCTKLYSVKSVGPNQAFCIYKSGSLKWVIERNIKVTEWREASEAQIAKINSLYNLIAKIKKSNPEKSPQLDALWKAHNESIASVPESLKDTFGEFIYSNNQTDRFIVEVSSIVKNLGTDLGTAPTKKTINCVKGKITKKVTGINPKCPTGFKKK